MKGLGNELLNCTEGLTTGNIWNHLYFCCTFFPTLGYLFQFFEWIFIKTVKLRIFMFLENSANL